MRDLLNSFKTRSSLNIMYTFADIILTLDVLFYNQNKWKGRLKTTALPDGSKELLLDVEGVVPKATSKLGCSRLFWAGVTGDGEGAMKEPPNPRKNSSRNI